MRPKFKIALATIAVLFIILYVIFLKTDYLIPSRIEIQDPAGFTKCIINELDKELPPSDTLYIATLKLYGICGTGIETPSPFEEKISRLKEGIKEPVYISDSRYESLYGFSNRIILTGNAIGGPEGCNCFISKKSIALTPGFIKKLYLINYEKLRKNDADILITDFENINTILKFNMKFSKGKWQVVE
ncbi:hypothetical protein [Flavobacterium suzhouense]|uniref:Tissue inhibitor of metalloproteinase n=1 Tax=Flavobacterium suzhouense TaxID=1529638 RepID=A0ABW5NWV7_9FLAO